MGCLLAAAAARADVGTDRPGSILIFPKVVRDGTRNTLIQLTNTGNLVNNVACFYLNGAPGRNGAPLCSEVDFFITLTRQQPTHWDASAGRQVNPSDPFGSDGSGFDPGLVPPVPVGFTGALVCIEVDQNGMPVAQNKLKGEAIISGPGGGDLSEYNAVAITSASPGPNSDNILNLNGGSVTPPAEYASCPSSLRMSFIPDGAQDPVIETYGNGGGQSSVVTNLTVVPCDLDFQNGVRTSGALTVFAWDEFEVRFSDSHPFGCWTSFNIGALANMRSALLTGGLIQTQFAEAQLISSGSPVVGVAESFHADAIGTVGTSAVNVHEEGGGNIIGNTANIRLPN
jgi:hypothetical protein